VQWPFQFAILESSFIRREVMLKLGCFTEGLQHSEDVLAGIQVACRYRVAAIPTVVAKYFRTSDLATSSAMLNGDIVDYYRARIWAFEEIIKTGRRQPWNRRYASMVRGLSRVLARRGNHSRELGWQQFRYGGVSAKGVIFLAADILGPWALSVWERIAELASGRPIPETYSEIEKRDFRALLRPLSNTSGSVITAALQSATDPISNATSNNATEQPKVARTPTLQTSTRRII
jgi:hypothetical protein